MAQDAPVAAQVQDTINWVTSLTPSDDINQKVPNIKRLRKLTQVMTTIVVDK